MLPLYSSKLITNGSLLNARNIDRLDYWNTSIVQVTVDAMNDDYNKIKNFIGELNTTAFDVVISNIEKTLDTNVKVHLRVNYNPNEKEIAIRTLEFLKNQFGHNDNFYMYAAPLTLKNVKFPSEHFYDFLKLSIENGYEYNKELCEGKNDDDYLLSNLMISPSPISCYMRNKYRFSVDSEGYLYKCHRFLGRRNYSCGNVMTGIEINDMYRTFVTPELFDEKCNKCRLLPICQGGCVANKLLYSNDLSCAAVKNIIESVVLLYYSKLTEFQGEGVKP